MEDKGWKILEKLLRESTLTKKQLRALLLYAENIEQRIVKKGYVEFDGKKVHKGAFFRTLNQAKKNVRKSIITLIIMSYTGLMDTRQFNAIMQITDAMMQIKDQNVDLADLFIEKIKTIVNLRKRVK